jgi:hypothetical protein
LEALHLTQPGHAAQVRKPSLDGHGSERPFCDKSVSSTELP